MENDHQLEIVEPNSSYQYHWKCIENSMENMFKFEISVLHSDCDTFIMI